MTDLADKERHLADKERHLGDKERHLGDKKKKQDSFYLLGAFLALRVASSSLSFVFG